MPDQPQPTRWTLGDVVAAAIILVLVVLGGYLAYRTYVAVGGFRGYVGVLGRLALQFALVLSAFVGYVALFALVHVIISIATGTKMRRVRVFVSFKHEFEPIADELSALNDGSIQLVKIPFREGRDHDDVIAESLEAVSEADMVIAVPGPTSSWMANELGLAVGTNKPVAVIKHLPDQRLSDSLYRGYPVFDIAKLRVQQFAGLRRFLSFATKSRSDVWPQFGRCVAGFGKLVAASFLVWWIVSTIIDGVSRFMFAFSPKRAEALMIGWYWTMFGAAAVLFAIGFGIAFARRVRGLAVARQRIRTRQATYAEFWEVFSLLDGDAQILAILEKEPLESKRADRPEASSPQPSAVSG